MNFRIMVGERDITVSREGEECQVNALMCPVSQAIMRAIQAYPVCVMPDRIRFVFADSYYSVPTPGAVVQWLRRYDRDQFVKPFEFDLEI